MLRPLTRADIDDVFAVLRQAPKFHLLTTGAPATSASATAVFDDLPPGKRPDSKRVYGVVDDRGDVVGVVEVIVGWPTPTTAMIGLLVIAEPAQGRGLGRAAVEDVEAVVDEEEGCDVARVAVVDANDGALAFWKKLGFTENGVTRPYAEGSVTATVIVLEKPLG